MRSRLGLLCLLAFGCVTSPRPRPAIERIAELEKDVAQLRRLAEHQLDEQPHSPPIASAGPLIPWWNPIRHTLLGSFAGAPFSSSGGGGAGVSLSVANTWTAAQRFSADIELDQGQKLAFDGATEAKYFSSDGTTLTLTGLSLTLTGALSLPDFTNITWPGSVAIGKGSGNYTGSCRNLPDGTCWPFPATVFHTGTVGANSSTTETTLVQATHLSQFGNDFDVAGRGYCVSASGNFASNTNTKTIKFKYGAGQTDATSGAFSGTTTTNGGSWDLFCRIVRSTSASAQHITCRMTTSSATAGNFVNVTTGAENLATLDWSGTLTGTGGATNDITNALLRVDFCP